MIRPNHWTDHIKKEGGIKANNRFKKTNLSTSKCQAHKTSFPLTLSAILDSFLKDPFSNRAPVIMCPISFLSSPFPPFFPSPLDSPTTGISQPTLTTPFFPSPSTNKLGLTTTHLFPPPAHLIISSSIFFLSSCGVFPK
ncbi:hypothetical protein EYC84_000379 [Monilinia fructicola]|uniref:Uncharacterized protein n=1 Tax=Monilinia fructicola TaxID=38448 RepID=A0A5M9JP21_MONFR|nr:hypothetical protein EYC84_000379 [Monilinia fructicola]